MAAVALVTGVAVASAEDKKPTEPPFDDAAFVKMAGCAGLHEVELGKIVAEKAKSAEVKKFAERVVKDLTRANEDLKAAAKAANITLPEKTDEKYQKHIDMFKNYMGDHFDADYMKYMVSDLTKIAALFTRARTEAKNEEIKNYATVTLAAIERHLDRAKELSK